MTRPCSTIPSGWTWTGPISVSTWPSVTACISASGAPLARLEVLAIVNAVLDRYSVIGLSEEPGERQTASLLTHGFVRLPLQLTR